MKDCLPEPIAAAVPYRRYSRAQITHQPGLTAGDRLLLVTMHQLDDPARGCWASNAFLASETGQTIGAVKSRLTRLRKKGYVVNIGQTVGGIALRRVVCLVEIPERTKLVYVEIPGEGRKTYRVNRSAKHQIPAVFAAQSDTPPVSNTDTQSGDKGYETPLSPSREGEISSLPKPAPVSTSGTTSRKRPDWVAEFMALDFSGWLLKSFGMTRISPGDARMVLRRLRRGTIDDLKLRYVTARLNRLPDTLDSSPARRPVDIGDLMRRFQPILKHILDYDCEEMRSNIRLEHAELAESESPAAMSYRALQHMRRNETKSLTGYVKDEYGTRACVWFVAALLHLRGRLPEEELLQHRHYALRACVYRPDIYDFMQKVWRFDMQVLTGVTKEEVLELREKLAAELKHLMHIATARPSFIHIYVATQMFSGRFTFIANRCFQFSDSGGDLLSFEECVQEYAA